jgi:hypothetical protein
MANQNEHPKTVPEIAQQYGLAAITVRKYALNHNVPYIGQDRGKRYLFSLEDEEAFQLYLKRPGSHTKGRKKTRPILIFQYTGNTPPKIHYFAKGYEDAFEYITHPKKPAVYLECKTGGQVFANFKKTLGKEDEKRLHDFLETNHFPKIILIIRKKPDTPYCFFNATALSKAEKVHCYYTIGCRHVSIVEKNNRESNELFARRACKENQKLYKVSLSTIQKILEENQDR